MAVRAERAVRAARLRSLGLTREQIAGALGVSRSYAASLLTDPTGEKDRARKRKYGGTCLVCGKTTDGSNGYALAPTLCRKHTIEEQKRNKRWTREAVIEAIRLFASENGRPPVATEWATGPRDYRFPPLSAVFRHNHRTSHNNPFASWADAVEAAGFPRPERGRNRRPRGEGASHKMREYIVLTRNGDEAWHENRVQAYSPELAIEKVAATAGEYIAVLDRYWVSREVKPVTKLAVVKPGK